MCSSASKSGITRERRRRRNACAPVANTTSWKMWGLRSAITPFSRCSAIFPSAIISRKKPSPTPGSSSLRQNGPPDRIAAIPGLKENFWAMGDTGPCGPCSEIHYDMGPAASEQGHTDCKFPCDCGRYVEIWNLVFMQFNRLPPGGWLRADDDVAQELIARRNFPVAPAIKTSEDVPNLVRYSSQLDPLPKPCVYTGMGLERVAAVLQGVISNYDTDLFQPLMKRAAELCGVDFEKEEKLEEGKGGAASLRVIADHARATTFLITDGVLPSNEGRGYVLRKIMRRAIRHGRLLGATQPFFTEMIVAVRALMHVAYPELFGPEAAHLLKAINEEEKRFGQTLD